MFVAHNMHHIRGCLPVSYEWFRVVLSLTSVGRIYPCCEEEKTIETVWPTAGIIWMNSVWAAMNQFLSFNWVLNVFFLPFCLVWNLAVRGCSLPLSLPSAQSEHCVLSLTVWLTVAVPVWECQRLRVCHAVRTRSSVSNLKIEEIISDFGLTNWEQHDSSGNSLNHLGDVICWYTQGKVKFIWSILFTIAIHWFL